MEYSFREISGIPDYTAIVELIKAEWPDEFGEKSDSEMISDMIESHDTEKDRVVFMYRDDRVSGFYRYSAWPRSARSTDTAHTYDISVLPEEQRQGLGTRLMLHMIEDCKNNGYKKLLSRSFKSNTASIGLHRSLGFRKSFENDDSIVWELSIASE